MWPDRTRRAMVLDGIEYAPGAKFEVVKPGLRLTGWTAGVGCQQGWGQTLQVGDVIECTGFGAGMGSDPGFGVEWRSEESTAARAGHCDIWPSTGGAFAYRPPAGSVRRIEDES